VRPVLRFEVVDDGGRSAAQRGQCAVRIGIDAVNAGAVQVADQTVVGAPGAGVELQRIDLVVADQDHPVLVQPETAHAVELVGGQQAVGHRLAGLGRHAVGEALGQVQKAVGVGLHRAVAEHLVARRAVDEAARFGGHGVGAFSVARQGEGGGGGHEGAA